MTLFAQLLFKRYFVSLIGIWILAHCLGCQFAPKASKTIWPWKSKVEKGIPDRILPVWTESVLHQPNLPGVRGFGGRIYFYQKESTDPIEVEGSLAVYAFDADDTNSANQQPLRKYMFTSDQFASHMSKTSIGPSYSIWVPWGEIGGPPRRLSLIARFEGKAGGTTISDPTIKLLPGVSGGQEKTGQDRNLDPTGAPIQASSVQNLETSSTVSLAGHLVDPTGQSTTSSASMSSNERRGVQTIDLPPTFQRHLKGEDRRINEPTKLPKPTERSDLKPLTTSRLSARVNELSSQYDKTEGTDLDSQTMDNTVLSSEEAIPNARPTTTQVYDYRNRNRLRSGPKIAGQSSKVDIREGRWIKSINRDEE